MQACNVMVSVKHLFLLKFKVENRYVFAAKISNSSIENTDNKLTK